MKSSVSNPDLSRESQLSYMMHGRREVARFAYCDADKNLLGYVVRLEDKDGTKITPTLTYCRSDKGVEAWRFQGFADGRPLYGLDHLKQNPTAPVLVVEGEKTAEAARDIFKDHVVVTWPGGCGAVHKADWSPLQNRTVTLFPDHDKPGLNAALKIAEILQTNGRQTVDKHHVIDIQMHGHSYAPGGTLFDKMSPQSLFS